MSEQRKQNLRQLRKDSAFDVAVIGGGVNGIGVFRDLALQGLRILLAERNDFCSGCSAAPSRMIHGGLRYLENGEFDLVREALRERDALLLNAPHMVRPLPTVIPVTSIFSGMLNAAVSFFGWQGRPYRRGAIPIKLGLSLYDWMSRNHTNLPGHRFISGRRTHRDWPELTPRAVLSAVYYDAQITHPERLCLEMVRDTKRTAPECVALNYAEMRCEGDGYVVTDRCGAETLTISPKVIVNATGAWLDDTVQLLGDVVNEKMVSGTRGSHLIIDSPELLEALADHLVYFENIDGRVCIVVPYQGMVLAGSTDIPAGKASRVRCEPDELDYILKSLRIVFPNLVVTPDQVVFSFSGIRPLPYSDQDFTGRISRGHHTRRLDGPVPKFCMVGGKWTTFRAFAEQTTDEVLAELGRTRRVSTVALPIGGGTGFPDDPAELHRRLVDGFRIAPDQAMHLIDRYGSQAEDIAAFCQSRRDVPLVEGSCYSEAEIVWLLRAEFTETLSDIVLRRTSLAVTGQISLELLDRLGAVVARERNLDDAEISDQKEALIQELAEFHGVARDSLAARDRDRRKECVKVPKQG